MRAIAIQAFGGPEALALHDLPRPKAARGEILLRIVAAGVNPVDVKIREGKLPAGVTHGFPLIPGWDAAGVVDELGEGSQRFRKGDRVFVYARKPHVQWGTYAEYVAVPERHVALMPSSFLFEEAAALPCAGLTALQAFERAGLAKGQAVVVLNGSGGVGHLALQLARIAGARAIATAGPRNQEFILACGAAAGIDYTRDDLVAAVRSRFPDGADVVLDALGGDVLLPALEVVKPGGVLVSVAGTLDPDAARAKGVRFERITSAPSGEQLAVLAAHAERKKLKPHVETIHPLAAAAQAQEDVKAGHVRGKRVLAL
ncbi:MAG TPA: NADP-dependent oxidoreductase [Candidatus Polarisedimenticolaceae bacterium]|nr:NADP-dependent oxidoreductase [Candidatus Polarisedimenticolaceae bacterium]